MSDAQEFTTWAEEQGVDINGVAIQEYEGRGFGLIATKDIKVRHACYLVYLFLLKFGSHSILGY
jgi:hypothetical protein